MAARPVLYEIRVYPLVYKFLTYHYDTAPFLISSRHGAKNPFASFLSACLDRYDFRDTKTPRKYAHLTESLTVGIPPNYIKQFGAGSLSATKVSAFNDFAKQLFFEKLTDEVHMAMSFGVGIKTATERFLNRYGISEDELPIEMALRYYDRVCRKKLLLDYCPVLPGAAVVILPHERDSSDGQMESGWRQVA